MMREIQHVLDRNALTVNGKKIGENIADAPCWNRDVIKTVNEPFKEKAGIAHVTAFGHTLHVTGEDEAAVERAVAPFFPEETLKWRKAEPTLEDVFIHLMAGAPENGTQ